MVASERLPVERVDLLPCRYGWPLRGAEVGASEWRSVGREHLLLSRVEWRFADPAVGASERLSVGRGNLPQRRASRPTGGVSVGASERLSVESGAMRIPSPNEGAQGCPAVDSSCGGRRGGVVAKRRCAARRGVCFFSPRHAQSATARRVRVRVALVVDRVVAMRFASLARSSATAPVSNLRSLPRVVVRSVLSSGDAEEANDRNLPGSFSRGFD